MSIEKVVRKKGTVWRVRWRDNDGVPRSKVLGRKADAQAFDDAIKHQKRTGSLAQYEAGTQTLAAFAEEWWKLYAEPHLAERTRKSYAGTWDRHVLPDLGSVPLRELSAADIEAHLSRLRDKGTGAPTVHRVYVLLSSVLQRAYEWGRISENPCRRVRSRAPRRARNVVPLTDAQISALRDACWRPRDRFIIGALAYGGFRPSELAALEWADVGRNYITVNRAIEPGEGTKITKSHNGERQVKISHQLQAVIQEHPDYGEYGMGSHTVPLVRRHDGRPFNDGTWSTWHKDVWKPICQETGIEAVPYDLRHTFVSRLIEDGASVVKVAKQAGNDPVTTLKVYAHLFDETVD